MNQIISELEKISENAEKTFGSLSAEQINWKPDAESWSVGQCFEHLIKSNSLFFPELDKIAGGGRKNSFWESWSPLTSFGGNFLIKSLSKDEKKFKVPTKTVVPPSEIDAGIIKNFAAHQAELLEKIKRTETADWKKTIVTSPFMSLMTYSLEHGFQIIVEHEKRHSRQAERVMQTDGFPK